jgi:phage-related protein
MSIMEGPKAREGKPLEWARSSRHDFMTFPPDVVRDFGHDLWMVQLGETPESAKPLKGFGGAGVLELAERHDGDTYRVVYTVKFKQAVYVLHAFQKKAKQGGKTPHKEIELVRSRLLAARQDYARRYGNEAQEQSSR